MCRCHRALLDYCGNSLRHFLLSSLFQRRLGVWHSKCPPHFECQIDHDARRSLLRWLNDRWSRSARHHLPPPPPPPLHHCWEREHLCLHARRRCVAALTFWRRGAERSWGEKNAASRAVSVLPALGIARFLLLVPAVELKRDGWGAAVDPPSPPFTDPGQLWSHVAETVSLWKALQRPRWCAQRCAQKLHRHLPAPFRRMLVLMLMMLISSEHLKQTHFLKHRSALQSTSSQQSRQIQQI